MNSQHILDSCSTWLAYNICQHYYGQTHYVWCSPYFDPSSKLSQHNCIPPSSSPRDIYWSLKKDIDNGDMHSAKVRDVRRGILKGAGIKRNKAVAIRHRANPLSEEYTIENLPREFFDAFEL